MQSSSEGTMSIADLANQLRREKIYTNSERQLLQNLNEEVEKCMLELLQAAWICSMQRQNLMNLMSSRCEADSIVACQRASLLEGTTFIDAHKVLKYKEVEALGDLLSWLRDSPHLVALCLLLGEDQISPSLLPSLVAGLYGSCKSVEDRTRLLAVIRSLIKHHMAQSSEPRKLLQREKCALFSLYTVFRDGHTPAQQFLVAALQGPVMAVLQEDEFFLDADPDKIMDRFSMGDRLKRFGQPSSNDYPVKVARYRKWAVQSLYNLTMKFVHSLRENWSMFPPSIAWIVQQITHLLKQHSSASDRDLHILCTELVLTHFVCPAIINPDSHGVVDVPVSYIARFNLMQIAQIIQMLSHAKYLEVEAKVRDLYGKFERGCVWALVEAAGEGGAAPAPPVPPAPPAPPAPRTRPLPHTTRALYTQYDLRDLITFLRHISSKLNNNTTNNESVANGDAQVAEASAAVTNEANGESGETARSAASLAALLQTLEPNYRSRLHDLLRKMPDLTQLKQTIEPKENPIENGHRRNLLSKMPKTRMPRSSSASSSLDEKTNGEKDEHVEHSEVLIIKLANVEEHDYVGLEPESKVLEWYYGGEPADAEEAAGALAPPAPGAPVQKRTRFSVSHDEVSLGNTSDNLEAVSEAASNHSVTSSLELETEDQNDNLSDMVSANVSGRGSPNISGRETPSSQVTDGDAAGEPVPRRIPPNAPANQPNSAQAKLLKQTRNDIEDKFCKFEIKKLLEGDETISIMSDTWSTDVLASDSETIGDSCDQTQIAANQAGTGGTAPDVSETASESAWSMDVLASDSDRNTEVDTDDCVSVAARSDTSWPRRPSNHEEITPVKLTNGSLKRPDVNSPKHTSRPNLPNWGAGYQSATAALSRGGELDLPAPRHSLDNRKSILVNGYPVMCYASAPHSPTPVHPQHAFEFVPQNGSSAQTESTLNGSNSQSDATSQWVDDSFPQPHHSPDRPFPSTSKYDLPSTSKSYDDDVDRSLNSSESSFNALSVSQYDRDRRFDSGVETDRPDSERHDLVARMSSATISNRVKEIRTSIVSISSSRIDKKTSNVSLSTLSVNSASSSSQEVNSEISTERRVSPPPASTGAIPKSISFDSTAEKSQRRRLPLVPLVGEDGLVGLDELKNNVKRSGGNLLHKIKMFRQKGRSHQHQNDVKVPEEESRVESIARVEPREGESSEDILAKYRGKSSGEVRQRRPSRRASDVPDVDDRSEGVLDLNDPEVFNSMKRKLRVVLSNPELQFVEFEPSRSTSASLVEWVRWSSGEGGAALGAALARAGAGAAGGAVSRLGAALRADLSARRPYAQYLSRCRGALGAARAELRARGARARAEAAACARAAAAARTLELLERARMLMRLAKNPYANNNFNRNGGELMDEKASRLNASIKAITAEVKADPSWEGATASMLEAAELTVERAAFGRLYLQVLYPNFDGDIARDQVLSEHVRRLSACTGAARAGVGARHRWATPFPRAQQLLRHLAVYRTPRDKIACVMRCVTSIMTVLSLTEGAAPAADDLTPVLIYVILKVNPPSLLSTIEMVNTLGGPWLTGEAQYWWTQFTAAVAYIKTMDYPRAEQNDS